MKVRAIKTSVFKPKQDLLKFIGQYVSPREGDILIVTSKIVALAENRVVRQEENISKEEVIKRESEFAMPTKYTWLTIKDNMVMTSAGIDESNADGDMILLPKDSFRQARIIRDHFRAANKLKHFGVIITDSRCLPLRAGITGAAIGYAGFRGLKKYRGKQDIFGRKLKISRVDVADSLATAAVLCMGEGNERRPLAVISGIGVEWSDKTYRKELEIDPRIDVYQPLFENIASIDFSKRGKKKAKNV